MKITILLTLIICIFISNAHTKINPYVNTFNLQVPYAYSYAAPGNIVQKKAPHIFTIMSGFSSESNTHGYDTHGNTVPLTDIIFCKNLTIKDIHLISKLALENKLFLPGQSPGFGCLPQDQYIACLAPTKLNFFAQQEQHKFFIDLLYSRIIRKSSNCSLHIGLHVPLKQSKHFIDFSIEGGSFELSVCSNPIMTESNFKQFFNRYNIDFIDYFRRGILQPKGLNFKRVQERTGLGDLEVFTAFSITPTKNLTLNSGIKIHMPTSNQQKHKTLWEVILGDNTLWSVSLFLHLFRETSRRYLNPFLYTSIKYSFKKYLPVRLAKLKTSREELFIPEDFQLHSIKPFENLDTTCAPFADQVVNNSFRCGEKINLVVGNTAKKIFHSPLDLHLSLRTTKNFKSRMSLPRGCCNMFNTAALNQTHESLKIVVSWFLTWKTNNTFSLLFGARHSVAGQNTPKGHKIMCTLTGSF